MTILFSSSFCSPPPFSFFLFLFLFVSGFYHPLHHLENEGGGIHNSFIFGCLFIALFLIPPPVKDGTKIGRKKSSVTCTWEAPEGQACTSKGIRISLLCNGLSLSLSSTEYCAVLRVQHPSVCFFSISLRAAGLGTE